MLISQKMPTLEDDVEPILPIGSLDPAQLAERVREHLRTTHLHRDVVAAVAENVNISQEFRFSRKLSKISIVFFYKFKLLD